MKLVDFFFWFTTYSFYFGTPINRLKGSLKISSAKQEDTFTEQKKITTEQQQNKTTTEQKKNYSSINITNLQPVNNRTEQQLNKKKL